MLTALGMKGTVLGTSSCSIPSYSHLLHPPVSSREEGEGVGGRRPAVLWMPPSRLLHCTEMISIRSPYREGVARVKTEGKQVRLLDYGKTAGKFTVHVSLDTVKLGCSLDDGRGDFGQR